MIDIVPDRAVLLGDTIRPQTAAIAVDRILELAHRGSDDIFVCIDSDGGDVKAGLAIYEAIQLASCDVATLCFGTAGSMAALLLAAGTARKRFAVPHARIVVHDPIHLGRKLDENDELSLMIQLKDTVDAIMLRHSGRSWRDLQEAQGRAVSLTAGEAMKLGLIDHATLKARIR